MGKIIAIFVLSLISLFSEAAYTHVIHLDKSGSDEIGDGSFANPVASISKAMKLAESLDNNENNPALIRIGQGKFFAPDTIWTVDCKWVNFRGNGSKNTIIDADFIIIDSKAITGFDDLAFNGCLDIGNTILPVCNVEIMQLKKKGGILDGVWHDLSGNLFYGSKKMSSLLETESEQLSEKSKEQNNNKSNLNNLKLRNYLIINEYIEDCSKRKIVIPIGKFSWKVVENYWDDVPELKAARDKFEEADDELKKVLMNDSEYKNIVDASFRTKDDKLSNKTVRKTKCGVYHRLAKTSPEYRAARKKRDETLRLSNEISLKYINNDYKKKNILFPVDWIDERKIKNYLKIIRIGKGLNFDY